MKVKHIDRGWGGWQVLFVLLPVAVVAGCQDECEPGQARCFDDTTLESCREYKSSEIYEPPHWERIKCYDEAWNVTRCVVAPTGAAYCAADDEVHFDICGVPEGPPGTVTWICGGTGRIVGCVDGIILFYRTCGTGRCIEPSSGDRVFCSILPDPDPLCEADTHSTCADETTRIECQEGYRIEQDYCPGAGGCRTAILDGPRGTFVTGLCALAPMTDSRCEEAEASGRNGYCDGSTAVFCFLGYPIMTANCDSRCFDLGDWLECIGGKFETEEGWELGDPPDCSDGFDNDYDGLVDYPDDPSCTSSTVGSG